MTDAGMQLPMPCVLEGASFAATGHGFIDDVTLSVGRGEIAMITGPTGAGKSLLLRGVVGLTKPVRGRVLLFGRSLVDLNHDEMMGVRLRMAYASANAPLVANLTVRDNLATPLLLRGMIWVDVRARLESALERLGIADLQDKRPHELSQLQHGLAVLARALVVPADLLVLDEPSRGLSDAKNDVLAELLRVAASDGTAILLSIGDPSRWHDRVDRMVTLTLPPSR